MSVDSSQELNQADIIWQQITKERNELEILNQEINQNNKKK